MHAVANSALRLVASMKRDWMQVYFSCVFLETLSRRMALSKSAVPSRVLFVNLTERFLCRQEDDRVVFVEQHSSLLLTFMGLSDQKLMWYACSPLVHFYLF